MGCAVLEVEEWLPIAGRHGYEISSFGRLRSWRKRGYGTEFHKEPHFLNPTPDRDGYLEGSFYECGKHVKYFVHRLMLETFVGPRPTPSHQAAHRDGCRQNNRIDNLYWATPLENAADCIRHGNRPRGENHADAVLTENLVREIRANKGLVTSATLAARFGVNRSTVKNVWRGKTWRHVA